MGLLDFFQSDHDEVHNKGNFTHDLLAGAVAFEAAKAYEDHVAAQGKPDSHARAKEIFAGLAAAATTRLIETKGLDAYDAHKLQAGAQRRFETVTVNEYD